MIKNIIFDIGGVLTGFDPNDYLGPFNFDEQTSKALSNAIFKNENWKKYMIGEISSTEFKRLAVQANPALKAQIEFVLAPENTYKMLPRLEEGISFLKNMKLAGHNIYILSNIVDDSLSYFKSNFGDVTKLLSGGGIYSCEVHLKKPDEKIFTLILEKYGLNPKETLFLDDSEKNVQKAKELGIQGELCQPVLKKNEFARIESLYKLTKTK